MRYVSTGTADTANRIAFLAFLLSSFCYVVA